MEIILNPFEKGVYALMGIKEHDYLSVSPVSVHPLRKTIARLCMAGVFVYLRGVKEINGETTIDDILRLDIKLTNSTVMHSISLEDIIIATPSYLSFRSRSEGRETSVIICTSSFKDQHERENLILESLADLFIRHNKGTIASFNHAEYFKKALTVRKEKLQENTDFLKLLDELGLLNGQKKSLEQDQKYVEAAELRDKTIPNKIKEINEKFFVKQSE
ncbi:MAG: hypothetical protein KBC98_00310 [Candidatus Pacebacteria bacterium]|nr:hypothetical protein [Candidatus Paceibacterota bacterium]